MTNVEECRPELSPGQKKIAKRVEVANKCMAIIEEAGLSWEEASYIPDWLEKTIESSRLVAMAETGFKASPASYWPDGRGGYDVQPRPFADLMHL